MRTNPIRVFAVLMALLLSSCVFKKEQTLELDLTEKGCFEINVINERSGENATKGGVMNVVVNDLLRVEVSPLQELYTHEYAIVNMVYFDETVSRNLSDNELPFSIGIKVPELPIGRYPISIICTLNSEDQDKIYINKSTFDLYVQVN